MLPAFAVADRVTGKNPDRRSSYALAVVAGAAIGVPVAVSVATFLLHPLLYDTVGGGFKPGYALYFFLDLLLLAWAAVWVINDRRRAGRARTLMHRAELDRIDAAKRTVESELQAMQARVEPQFLFNTLAQVKRLYEDDPSRAERMLDDLIAYLRAAMPKMRDTSSTLAQETELARAYLDIVKVRLGDRLNYEIEAREATDEARMPPMMLLPLIEHAITPPPGGAETAQSLRIEISANVGRLRIAVFDDSGAFEPDRTQGVLEELRERLAALYGPEASLVLRRNADGMTEAILDLPFESAERTQETTAVTSRLSATAVASRSEGAQARLYRGSGG
jgi:hypothetical protein